MLKIYIGPDNDKILLPVTPKSIGVERENIVNTEYLLGKGDVSIFAGDKLKKISVNSFFPKKYYPFCTTTNIINPYIFVDKFIEWIRAGQVVRLTVTDTNINMPCYISRFDTEEKDGTGDLYYNLEVTEYRVPKIKKMTSSSIREESPTQSNPQTTQQRIHKVVKDDNLWDLAQKYYGNGKLYPKIKEANLNKYPKLKNSNVIYVGWELIIP